MASQASDASTHRPRVCILSGGGDAPGVNAVVRGFVHAARQLAIDVMGCRYGFEGLLEPDGIAPLTTADVRGILPKGGCVLGCSTRINPFFAPANAQATKDYGPEIVARLRDKGISRLVLIGGDGTTLAAQRFTKLGMGCIAVPKTIDNDLGDTDTTCGFESAVEVVTHAVDSLHATAEAHARVMIVEVMGRNAGWIALAGGVAGGADVILLPEIPYRLERVVAKIREREALKMRFSIIVIAEGARPSGGDVLEIEDAHPGRLARLGGAGARLLQELERAQLDHEIRLTVLGHLQRGGSPCAGDRILGTQLGAYAAQLCKEGAAGKRIVVSGGVLTTIPLATSEVGAHKTVTASHPLMQAARLLGIEIGDATGAAKEPSS
jgi:6-phosphofructokinase 1